MNWSTVAALVPTPSPIPSIPVSSSAVVSSAPAIANSSTASSTPPTDLPIQIVNNISPSNTSWLVPLATLAGAIIAASVFLYNKRRKAKREDAHHELERVREDSHHLAEMEREDQRQWDKEIRDLYVQAVPIVEKMRDIVRSLKVVDYPWPPEMNEYYDGRTADNRGMYPDLSEAVAAFEPILYSVQIIAADPTYEAFKDVYEKTRAIQVNIHDGVFPLKDGLLQVPK